jgi:signal transduction histidine kinase
MKKDTDNRSESRPSQHEWIRMFVHELKNHLATISMNVEMIEEDMAREDEFPLEPNRKRVARINKGIHFMREALQDFNALSDPLDISKNPVDLNELLRELGDFIEPECYSRDIRVEYELTEGIPSVETDKKHLSSALLNLIINAKEAIEENGVITLASHRTQSGIAVEVKDTGGGITPENEQKIFKDFFSTKDDGTGLGLTIVKKTVDELGGTVEFENRTGEGMTFTVTLPAR